MAIELTGELAPKGTGFTKLVDSKNIDFANTPTDATTGLKSLTASTTNTDGDHFVVVDADTNASYKLAKGSIDISGFNNDSSFTDGSSITVADESSDTTCFPVFSTAATGAVGPKTGSNLTFNSSTGILTATGFAGPITGAVTGNADTATKITSITNSDIVQLTASQTLTNKTLTTPIIGDMSSCTFPTLNQSTTGNATTATTAAEATEVTVTANDNEGADLYPVFVDGASGAQGIETDSALTYNPGANLLTAGSYDGAWVGSTIGIPYGGTGQITAAAAANALLNVSQGGTLTIGDASDIITVPGTLSVTGTINYINSTNTEITDKNILLAASAGVSTYADDAAAVTAASGGGISLETDSTTTANYASLVWTSSDPLTGWSVKDTGAVAGTIAKFPLAIQSQSTSALTDEENAPVGAFHYDTSGKDLYIRID